MIDYLGMVRRFHEKYKHSIHIFPNQVEDETWDLRIKLIDEEVNEELIPILKMLKEKRRLGGYILTDDSVQLYDAIADSLYVIFGTALSCGAHYIDDVYAEVHRSNMTKSMGKDTKSIKGKTIKGSDYDPPKIENFI